jgi:DNA repair exonuclease SbcCD nuclease subunit
MTVRFVFRTDVHLSDRSPSSWKASYYDEVLSNLRQVADIARNVDAHAVLDGGDFFHVKAPHKNSHAMVAEAIRLHREDYPCKVFSVVGNHDMQYNNLDTVEKQPLGVLYSSKALIPLTEEVFDSGGVRVRVVGCPYVPDRTLESLTTIRKKPGDDFLVLIVHALASEAPPSSVVEFFGEPVFRYEDLISTTATDGPDVICFGHWHKDQGIRVLNNVHFVNPGSLARGSLSFETLNRTPQAVIIELGSDIRTTAHPLIVAPAEDVFNMEVKEEKDREATKIAAFLEDLRTNLNTFSRGVSLRQTLSSLQVSQRVKAEAERYLEMFGIG